jgi:hypothetical protein
MKIINTKLHAILDYVIMFALVLPWLSDYYVKSKDTWVYAAIGGLIGLYSLFTDYEFGLIKLLPIKIHFALDIFLAFFLIISPFLFQLQHYYFYWPLSLGISLLIVVFFSSAAPYKITKRDLDITKP